MRSHVQQLVIFAYVSVEDRASLDLLIRKLRALADIILKELDLVFALPLPSVHVNDLVSDEHFPVG